MIKRIVVNFPDSQTTKPFEFNLSDICPHCKNAISPIAIYARASARRIKGTANNVGIFLQCPNPSCNQFFVNWFSIQINQIDDISQAQQLQYVYKPILKNDLPKEVNDKFPEFESIYSQAIQAESYGLDQIAGVGYRKALEFLVKQYSIYKNPADDEAIKKEFLGNTIKNRLSEFPKIQKLSQAATWIGNDETHFVRKHEDKDITSMKMFIKSTATFISADLDADDAIEFTKEN